MVCAPVRSIIPSLELGDYLSVQAHKPCSISHLLYAKTVWFLPKKYEEVCSAKAPLIFFSAKLSAFLIFCRTEGLNKFFTNNFVKLTRL